MEKYDLENALQSFYFFFFIKVLYVFTDSLHSCLSLFPLVLLCVPTPRVNDLFFSDCFIRTDAVHTHLPPNTHRQTEPVQTV